MATLRLTSKQKANLRSKGYAFDGFEVTQVKKTYWDKYGRRFPGLPGDGQSMAFYMMKGLTPFPPPNPEPMIEPPSYNEGIRDWDGRTKLTLEGFELYDEDDLPPESRPQAYSGPTATYYTEDGTAVPGLPADPVNMKQYLELGLSLKAPAQAELDEAVAAASGMEEENG